MALFNVFPETKSQFFSEANFVNLLKSSSIFLILAMGETVVLIAGGVDLSIGGMMALSGVVVLLLINAGVPIPVAVVLCLLLGLAVGAINAFISVYQRSEPFIITLGMGIVLSGIGQQLTDAHPVSRPLPAFADLANLKILGPVPILVLVMLAVLGVLYWMLRSTSFGRNVYAVGGDFEVAKYSGINVRRTRAATYLICSLLTPPSAASCSHRSSIRPARSPATTRRCTSCAPWSWAARPWLEASVAPSSRPSA